MLTCDRTDTVVTAASTAVKQHKRRRSCRRRFYISNTPQHLSPMAIFVWLLVVLSLLLMLSTLSSSFVIVRSMDYYKQTNEVPTNKQNQNHDNNSRKDLVQRQLSLIKQMDNESKEEYFQRITKAASDPKLFEQLALSNDSSSNVNNVAPKNNNSNTTTTTTTSTANTTGSSSGGGYVRAEEWEQQLVEKKRKGLISWEERVQFDGQRYGNQYNQNEILRKHLNGF